MSLEIRQLKDHNTNLPFVPLTHWDAVAGKPSIPSKTSDLTNDSGFITGFTESDPTVPAWAKEPSKPTYDMSEISGLTEELEDITYTVSSHIIELTDRMDAVESGKQDTLIEGPNVTISANTISVDLSDYYTSAETDNKISQLINDNNISASTTYSSQKITQLLADVGFSTEVVSVLPSTGDTKTIYLIPSPSSQTQNIYDEYLYTNNDWEKIGTTETDLTNYYTTAETQNILSDYYTTAQTDTFLSGKQDALSAGTNIEISANTISALGYVYDATKHSFAEGSGTTASGTFSHAEGSGTTASGTCSHAEGCRTTASETFSHAEGSGTTASGTYSHAEGSYSTAHANNSHAEGESCHGYGSCSHAEGENTFAYGKSSHSEGWHTQANDNYSHAEGYGSNASGNSAHAEGRETFAKGSYSHAEGYNTVATGDASHAEGDHTTAYTRYSHAEGYYAQTSNEYEHAEGVYNVTHKENNVYGSSGNTQHSIGIGTRSISSIDRKNAVEVMQNGDVYITGVGGYDGVHIKTETGYENTKTVQDTISAIETDLVTIINSI